MSREGWEGGVVKGGDHQEVRKDGSILSALHVSPRVLYNDRVGSKSDVVLRLENPGLLFSLTDSNCAWSSSGRSLVSYTSGSFEA